MSQVAVAGRYAQAIFEIAESRGQSAEVADGLFNFGQAFAQSRELRGALENPVIPVEQRQRVLASIVAELRGNDLVRDSLGVLLRRRRLSVTLEVAFALRGLADQRAGIIRAKVTTAQPMGEGFYSDLAASVGRALGAKVALDRLVDPAIVGGAVLEAQGRTVDQSVRGQLARAEAQLLRSLRGGLTAAS